MSSKVVVGAFAAIGLAVMGLFRLVAPGQGADSLYLAVGAMGAAAILAGIAINRPAHRTPWYLMAAGQTCWLAGDALYDPAATSPARADIAYLVAYPLLAAGIASLVRHRRAATDPGTLIDSAIVTLGAGLISWVFVADPILDDTSRTVASRAVAVAYPASDILLLGLLVALITASRARSVAAYLITAATVALVVADTIYASVTTEYGTNLDLLWLLAYLLWGLAALHPSMARLTEAPHHREPSITSRRLLSLCAAALVAPTLVLLQLTHNTHVDTWVVVTGASLLSLLVIVRLARNLEELRATRMHRDELQAQLFREASRDPLTGVANSPAMHQLIGAALRRGQREGTSVTVLLLDLDHVETINQRYGHLVGDQVIRIVADRLRAAAPDAEHVGRLAGDLFVVCTDSSRPEHESASLATHLMQAIDLPIALGGTTATLAASIGAAVSMDGGTDADELLQQAQVALRRAKAAGTGTFEIFGDALRQELIDRRDVEIALTEALDAGMLEVHYQPIVAVQSDIVDGYEARLHWNRPGHGWQDSTEFLAIAAMSDLICRIDLWAVATAAAHLAEWTRRDPTEFGDLTVSVTISGRTLGKVDLPDLVADILEQSGVAPHRLTIGVTEMALVDVPEATIQMTALRDRGIFVSVNEFGTGHTSIGQLRHLPADVIKIDSSLVSSDDPGSYDLLALLVNAAHGCGLLAVADGVPDADRLAELRELHYDSALGLHSSTSDPAESGVTVLRSAARGPHLRVVPDLPEE